MSYKESSLSNKKNLDLRIGPFVYQFKAYDHWGVKVLQQIQAHLAVNDLTDKDRIDRYIHLINLADSQNLRTLPAHLLELLPEHNRAHTWSRHCNQINTIWSAEDSAHTFWTAVSSPKLGTLRFDFPWAIIINDIVDHGGGLLHAGLACHEENGLLFLAPPCGGKTTTLGTAPANWKVLSDDAALIWPGEEKSWHASPLPAWGMIFKPSEEWLYPQMKLAQSCRLKSLLVLQKEVEVSLEKLQASTALPFVYRALCEYPVTIISKDLRAEAFFRTAAAMTRELTCWELSLPLHGDIWPLVSEEAA